jgi:hypothetical protein
MSTAQLVCRLVDGDITLCFALGWETEFAFDEDTLATVDRAILEENRLRW